MWKQILWSLLNEFPPLRYFARPVLPDLPSVAACFEFLLVFSKLKKMFSWAVIR